MNTKTAILVLCYHNGALGHTVSALIDCCTKEGPSFVPGENLHHYNTKSLLYQIKISAASLPVSAPESVPIHAGCTGRCAIFQRTPLLT